MVVIRFAVFDCELPCCYRSNAVVYLCMFCVVNTTLVNC